MGISQSCILFFSIKLSPDLPGGIQSDKAGDGSVIAGFGIGRKVASREFLVPAMIGDALAADTLA